MAAATENGKKAFVVDFERDHRTKTSSISDWWSAVEALPRRHHVRNQLRIRFDYLRDT